MAPGGGSFLGDAAGGDASALTSVAAATAVPGTEPRQEDPRSRLVRELDKIPTVWDTRERRRWAKGHGLEGEVEEEAEMRDAYLRPGVPRK